MTASRPAELLPQLRDLARNDLREQADRSEAASAFPRDLVTELGRNGVLGLPFPRELGGGGWAFASYLEALEILASGWLTVAETVAVHALASYPIAAFGAPAQQRDLLGPLLAGEVLGAYARSEPDAGSDAAALATRATLDGDQYRVTGTKAWITHAGHAGLYNLFVRTGGPGPDGISCLAADASTPGLSTARPEDKMGLRASPVAQVLLDDARIPADRLVGRPGQGFRIAMSALNLGRLGIAACATGLASAALELAVDYAASRPQFGKPIAEFQGTGFALADMATAVEAGRALYQSAARRRDAGQDTAKDAAMAKLFCTDTAMAVTTHAVQILGAVGYTTRYPAERYMREAKVLQIFEGTNQIQRLVISRWLRAEHTRLGSGGRSATSG